jgi:UDPglucose 6-dehydrogenase
MQRKIIGVVGQGFVGGALTQVMSRFYDVWVYDKAGHVAVGGQVPVRRSGGPSIAHLVEECETADGFTGVFFVCVPTPMKPSGECDVSIVQSVLDELAAAPGAMRRDRPTRIAVVKSTVPPGTCQRWNERYSDRLRVVFNPEFLTEANALRDFEEQSRIVIGGDRPWSDAVKHVFELAFPNVPIIKTSSTIAEMVKYTTNCFLATKVAFANEMKQTCDAVGADYDKVIEYARYDGRLGTTHWAVPGPDGAAGYGGHCLPKDLRGLSFLAQSLGCSTTILDAVWTKNNEVRAPEHRDWERMKGRAVSA